jgi:hypothetical protein
MELKEALQIVLDAWRHYDDENDLEAFEMLMVGAIRAMDASSSYGHLAILKSIFREVVKDAESTDKGEHLHE